MHQSHLAILTLVCTLALGAGAAFGSPASRGLTSGPTKIAKASRIRPEAQQARRELDAMISDMEAGKTVDQARLLRALRGTHN